MKCHKFVQATCVDETPPQEGVALLPSHPRHPAYDKTTQTMTCLATTTSCVPQREAPWCCHDVQIMRFPCRCQDDAPTRPRAAPTRSGAAAPRKSGAASRTSGRHLRGGSLRVPALWVVVVLTLYSSGLAIPVVFSSSADADRERLEEVRSRINFEDSWKWVEAHVEGHVETHMDGAGNRDEVTNEIQTRDLSSDSESVALFPFEDTKKHPLENKLESSSSSQPVPKSPSHPSNSSPSSSSSPSPVASKKLPQALIIGVKKGGTRAFLEFLRFHPDVRAPGPEPHFFDKNYERGFEWYRQLMPATLDNQLTIEKTPSYFVTRDVPARIHNMSTSVKLIVVVRDPVNRAISDYTQSSSKRPGMKSFEELAFLNNVTGLIDTSWPAIKIGVYAKHLTRWLQYFPLSQFHFVDGENLIRNPGEEMLRVQDFLGLRRVISEKDFVFNQSKGFPCLKRPLHPQSPLKCLGKTKGRQHPHVDSYTLDRLREFFRPFNQKFFQMIGQFMDWPSSRI